MKVLGNKVAAIILTLLAIGAVVSGCGAVDESEQSSNTEEWRDQDVRKGVNMDAYCKRKFGQTFAAAYLGNGEWVCQTSAHNRRPISVIEACQWQQNTSRVHFDQGTLAWSCVISQKVWVPVRTGVNMDAYCKRQYGQSFSSQVIGPTAGDWVCQTGPHDRRPISVKQACLWQQGTAIHGYLNYNDPGSWYCEK